MFLSMQTMSDHWIRLTTNSPKLEPASTDIDPIPFFLLHATTCCCWGDIVPVYDMFGAKVKILTKHLDRYRSGVSFRSIPSCVKWNLGSQANKEKTQTNPTKQSLISDCKPPNSLVFKTHLNQNVKLREVFEHFCLSFSGFLSISFFFCKVCYAFLLKLSYSSSCFIPLSELHSSGSSIMCPWAGRTIFPAWMPWIAITLLWKHITKHH